MSNVTRLIDFEAKHPGPAQGRKYLAIQDELHVTLTRYYFRLNRILADEALLAEAMQHDPTTTQRLIRAREERAATRRKRTL